MDISKSNNIKAMIYCAIGYSCFAIADAIYKYVGQTHDIFTMNFYALLSSLAIISIIAATKGEFKKSLNPQNKSHHLFRGIIMFLQFVTFIMAITHMELSKAYTLIFIAPFITTIMAVIMFNEKTSVHSWLSIIIGFCGIIIVLRPGLIELDIWSISIIVSAILVSFANLLARKIHKPEDSFYTLPISVIIVSLIANIIIIPFVNENGYTLPDTATLAMLLITGIATAGGLYCIPKAFNIGQAKAVAPVHYIQMIWAIIFGLYIFNEQHDPYVYIGASIVIASGIYLIRSEKINR